MQIAMFLSDTSRAAGLLSRTGVPAPSLRVTETSRPAMTRADDEADLSPEALSKANAMRSGDDPEAADAAASRPLGSDGEPLSDDEVEQLRELEARDREVRTHEQAHVAAAGSLFRGGPTYSYQTGPDGKRYAVGGRVQIDTSEGSSPEETIQKARQIRAAALAPAEPSSTDQRVASQATRMEAEASAELAAEQAQSPSSAASPTDDAPAAASQEGARPDPKAADGYSRLGRNAIDAYASSMSRGDLETPRLSVAA